MLFSGRIKPGLKIVGRFLEGALPVVLVYGLSVVVHTGAGRIVFSEAAQVLSAILVSLPALVCLVVLHVFVYPSDKTRRIGVAFGLVFSVLHALSSTEGA